MDKKAQTLILVGLGVLALSILFIISQRPKETDEFASKLDIISSLGHARLYQYQE